MKEGQNISSYALKKLIISFEGFSPVIFRCPTGYKTIGHGHVIQDVDTVFKDLLGFSRVPHNITISEEMASEILKKDLEIFEKGVNKICPGLAQQEFDACVSFAFNMGLTAFKNSTLVKLISQGFKEEASAQFSRWVFGKDNSGVPVKLSGLLRRREVERLIFLSATKTPQVNKSYFTRDIGVVIEQMYINYAKLLFVEKSIKIELEV